jgi:cytochrome o ubiquinol oxidase subunit 2
VVIWGAPLLIIIALGPSPGSAPTSLDRTGAAAAHRRQRTVRRHQAAGGRGVALDWKWLFFYPEQGIATVNELAAPVDGRSSSASPRPT